MFRNKKLYRLLPSQLMAIQMNASSFTARSCSTMPRNAVQSEGSLIPEHLRFKKKESFFKKWQTIMNGETGPMVPMTIILVGTHVFVLWYLFGGEFEDDFGEDIHREGVRPFSSKVLAVKRIFTKFTTSLGLQSPKNTEQKLNEAD